MVYCIQYNGEIKMCEKKEEKIDIHDLIVGEWYDVDKIEGLDTSHGVHEIMKQENGKYSLRELVEVYFHTKNGSKMFQEYSLIEDAELVDW